MSFPQPSDSPVSRPYWEALSRGDLTYQHCAACGHDWLPPRDARLQVGGDKAAIVSNQGGTMHTHATLILGRAG